MFMYVFLYVCMCYLWRDKREKRERWCYLSQQWYIYSEFLKYESFFFLRAMTPKCQFQISACLSQNFLLCLLFERTLLHSKVMFLIFFDVKQLSFSKWLCLLIVVKGKTKQNTWQTNPLIIYRKFMDGI